MESKMKERHSHRLSPHFFSSDEGPETGEDSEDDLVRSYLPADRVFDPPPLYDNNHIPAINITLHSPNANHVLEAEICQLADIQENIQRMREGEVLDHQSLESRLSTSCPSLAVEAAKRKKSRHSHQHRNRRRSDRNRSPSMSTGESEEEEASEGVGDSSHRSSDSIHRSRDSVDTGRPRDRSSSLRPAMFEPPAGGGGGGLPPAEAVNQLAKSVSTPHIPENGVNNKNNNNTNNNPTSKTPRRRGGEPTHVFIQKLIAEHGWSKQGSGTDSETECEEATGTGRTHSSIPPNARILNPPNNHPSPQLTLAEFLQNPALVEEDQRKRRRNKKERGGSLFSLRKKKDKKEVGGKGLTKAGSAASLSRPVSAPRVPQHSYSMSSIKRYPQVPQTSSQFYLARSESSKSTTEDREDVDGDRENLLESEIPPSEEFPESFPLSFRNLEADPFLRLQKEEAETWATSVPPGTASALKPHEAKRQEHIYEFIMTEKHHCQLLKVIQRVFCEGMAAYLDLKPQLLERLFPQLDTLINIHFEFLRQLRIIQDSASVIPTIADVLLAQFHSDAASSWQSAYGAFCSQHTEAVNIYKDLLKSDRRFHEFVQQCSHNPLLRKMGIPECILTVTTRITKYPLLIEPLIKTAKDRPEEQQKLKNCLHLVKSILVNVNGQVAEKERGQRLIEIYNRLDAKSSIQVDGRKFKKSDFLLENRRLLFEGVATLVNPPLAPAPGAGRGNRSPAPTLVNVVVLSDVLVFLQDVNGKYTFVTPENRVGLVPVHSLIAREKPGTENKALYILSTNNDRDPEINEILVAQPRDRQEWIAGIRRAVDMSVGGPVEESEFETESQKAKKQLEAKYMRLREMTGQLRGRDMELGRVMEDKMRLLAEMLDEIGVEHNLAQVRYTQLMQERNMVLTQEDLLQELQEASRLAGAVYTSGSPLGRSVSSVGERQSDGYESPSLPKRAETFGGFDIDGRVRRRSESADGMPTTPPLMTLDASQQAAAAQLTHHLNNILSMVAEHFTSLHGLKVELAECKERAALGWGRYKHNQQLQELRAAQDQLQEERRHWQALKEEQERDYKAKEESMVKLQATLEQEKKDVEQQRDKLYRKLEALRAQGIDFAPNMTVIGHQQAPNPEPHFIMEVRKAVSPPTDGRKQTVAPTASQANLVNQNLISATIETKGDVLEVKQQIPSKLAKLSLAGGSKAKDKKSSSNLRQNLSAIQSASQPQMLPYKLSESEKKNSSISPKGYTKLSSSSFAEERVGRSSARDEGAHTRTGSSPAAMTGRPMSNTLPKSSKSESPDRGQQPLVQRVNYADSGEEVFFF